jgi:hypothetical protein
MMLLCFLGVLQKASQSTAADGMRQSEAGQSFGGGKLVAAEETRSGASGEHVKTRA